MAADNRNFVNKFANEGGGDVLVEDKRLEELKSATAKTAAQISTTTDYVPLQDTDGNLVKINPASFEEAVRNVLGSLLANNDKGTTISGVPALSGSGASLDFGSITPANLASVLGGLRFIGVMTVSPAPNYIKDAYDQGVYIGNPFRSDETETSPCKRGFLVTLTDYNTFGLQIIFSKMNFSDQDIRKIYWRLAWGNYKTYESNWKEIG